MNSKYHTTRWPLYAYLKRRDVMRRLAAVTSLLVVTLSSGCLYELRDEMAECRISHANKAAADAAYHNSGAVFMGMCCQHSFKEGFRTGYIDVANGGTGCPPAYPQLRLCNCMWLDHCNEKDKMAAWYDGYEMGAMFAKSDGMADSNSIVTRVPQPMEIDYSGTGYGKSKTKPLGPTEAPQPMEATPPTPTAEPPQAQQLPPALFQ